MIGTYRLRKEMLAIAVDTHIAKLVPEGSIVEIETDPLEKDRTVLAFLNGKPMVMFISDLKERADLVGRDAPTAVVATRNECCHCGKPTKLMIAEVPVCIACADVLAEGRAGPKVEDIEGAKVP